MSNRKSSYKLVLFAIGIFFASIGVSSASAQLVGGTTYPINGTDNAPIEFATLTSAITYLNTNGVSGTGSVVFEIGALYGGTEAAPVAINAYPGADASRPVIFRPATGVVASTVVPGAASPNQHAIRLNACSHVTLDGRQGGVGTVRSWTVRVTGSGPSGLGQMAVRLDNTSASMTNINIRYLIMQAEAANTTGAIFQITGSTTNTMTNVTVEENQIRSTATAATDTRGYGITVATASNVGNTGLVIRNNDVFQFYARGINITGGFPGAQVYGNSIHHTAAVTQQATAEFSGIYFSTTTSAGTAIYNNFVYDIQLTNGSTAVNGVYFFNANTTGNRVQAYNNRVAIGAGIVPTTLAIYGIRDNTTSGGLLDWYFNSIYIGGTPAAGTANSAACRKDASASLNFKNNICFNARSNGGTATGTHWGISANNTTFTSINNNDYFANGTGGVLGTTTNAVGGNQTTITGWKGVVAADTNSISQNPNYLNPVASPPNLKIDTAIPTQIESGAAIVAGITNDFEGDTRNATTPDIGADEFAGVGIDMSAPSIVYTPLGGTASLANRTLSTAISDATAVAGGALSPRIYFKKSTDASYVSTQCTLVVAPNYDCVINYTLVGGGSVAPNDIIQYFVVAQDTLGNLGANPGAGFVGTDVNTVTTPPTTPNTYSILILINSFPYAHNFEANNGGWTAGFTAGAATDWEYGNFAKTQISAPHSGSNAWITKLSGTYTTSTTSTLMSPVLDMSSLTGRPTFSFWSNFKTETGWDAGVLEYSVNGGGTWLKVDATLGSGGTFNTADSTGWYNSSSASGPIAPPKFSGTSTAYTGHASGWILTSTLLPVAVVGQSDVRLRFTLGADTVTNDEGWAIDDVSILPPSPGTVQFSPASYTVNENAVQTITATRTGGSAGAVTVNYATGGGTATGGTCGTDDYVTVAGIFSWADGESGPKTFNVVTCPDVVSDPGETFDITLSGPTGGVTIGGTNPATVNITDVPPPLSGSYTVGSGGNYPSLTNAGGIFEALNLSGASGPVTINITADLSGENGTASLNEIVGGHAVLIKPSGGVRNISGTSASSIIKLNGTDNVRIDGSTAATFAENVIGGTPGLRELTITNSGAGAAIWIATNATSGANNNVVRNLTIAGPGGFIGQGILAGSGAAFGTAAENGRPNSNNTINNLRVTGVQNALFAFGDATTLDQNWTVSENDLGSTVGAEKLSFRGIAVQNAQNAIITQNVIAGISSATSTSSTMSGILLGGVLNGGTISKNYIRDIRQNNTTGWGSNGIYLNSSSTAAGVVVANNFVSDVASQGFNGFDSADNGYGIMIDNGGGYSIYYNSVLMNAEQVAVGGHSSSLNVESTVPAGGLDVRNNIFVSTQTIGNTYGVIDQGTSAAAYAFINNNDYYSPLGTFNIGRLNSINQTTLAGWQGATGQDLASISADPLFTSATDLRPLFGTPVQDKGTAVSVLDDIDDSIRSVVGFSGGIPDMGAKERLGPSAAEASIGGRVVTANGQGIRNAVIVVTGNSLPQPILVRTGSFGYYKVDGLEVGETYVVTVNSKRFTFSSPSRIISLTDSVTDADFIADPQ